MMKNSILAAVVAASAFLLPGCGSSEGVQEFKAPQLERPAQGAVAEFLLDKEP